MENREWDGGGGAPSHVDTQQMAENCQVGDFVGQAALSDLGED